MLEVIIGNVSSIGAMICDSYSGTRRTRRDMLLVQIGSQFFYIVSSLILKGYSATVQNVVTVLRNLIALKGDYGKKTAIFLTVLPVVLGLAFNNRGLMGLIPVVANLEYSIVVFKAKDNANAVKIAFIINSIMFCAFNFYILNFVSGVACIVTSIITATSIYKSKQSKKNKTQN